MLSFVSGPSTTRGRSVFFIRCKHGLTKYKLYDILFFQLTIQDIRTQSCLLFPITISFHPVQQIFVSII